MAYKLQLKRGLTSALPTGSAGEPLFTTDTNDLYIGTGSANQRYQKYIASGSSSQFLKGDGSLDSTTYTPTSRTLTINGTSYDLSANRTWNVGTVTTAAATTSGQVSFFNGATVITSVSGLYFDGVDKLGIGNSSPAFNLDVTGTARMTGNLTAASIIKSGGTSSQYLMADGSTSTLTNPVTGTGTTNYLPKWTSGSALGNSAITDDGTTVTINSRFLNLTNTGESVLTLQDLDGTNQYLNIGHNGGASYFLSRDGSSNGNFVWYQSDGTSTSERMRLTSTGLGIGTTSPTSRFQSNNASTYNSSTPSGAIIASNLANGNAIIDIGVDSTYLGYIQSRNIADATPYNLLLNPLGGNLGLGVVPSAWYSSLSGIAFQMNAGSLYTLSNNSFYLNQNAYLNTSGNWIYLASTNASQYLQNAGTHIWNTAPSGTAGNAISFTQAMTLDASGRLGLGTTSPTQKLHIGGVGSAIAFDTTGASGTTIIQTVSDYELSIKNNRGTSSEIIVGNEVLSFKTNSSERLRITSGGNVGISITSPTAKLHTFSGTSNNQLTVDGTGAIKSGINFANSGTTYGQIYFDNNAPYDMSVLQQYTTGSLILGTNNTERMRIKSSGVINISNIPTSAVGLSSGDIYSSAGVLMIV